MVVIGVDAHKATHTLVGVDPGGSKLGELTVKATTDGHLKALDWARAQFGIDVVWGIEDCRNLSLRLERDLLNAGQRVVRVPPRLMAKMRASSRTWGKSDAIDALSVARAVLREPDLPVASHDEVSREFKLLMDRHDDLVTHRTAITNRLLWRIHELDPSHAPPSKALSRDKHQAALRDWLATQPGIVAEIARAETEEIIAVTAEIKPLERRIGARIRGAAPSLLTLQGCGILTAARLVGETAGVSRFRSEAAYARHAGVTPIPHSSAGKSVHARFGRSGNRRINAALYRIAMGQIRHGGIGESYYRARRELGDSHTEALRRVERRIVRRVFRHLQNDSANSASPAPALAPAATREPAHIA